MANRLVSDWSDGVVRAVGVLDLADLGDRREPDGTVLPHLLCEHPRRRRRRPRRPLRDGVRRAPQRGRGPHETPQDQSARPPAQPPERTLDLAWLPEEHRGGRQFGGDGRRRAVIETHLQRLLTTTDRTREIVSIWEEDRTVEYDLTSVVSAQIERISEEFPDAEIATEFDANCRVRSHSALPRAINEALQNAIEHTPGDVRITARIYQNKRGMAVVEVADTGQGIPKFDVEAIEGREETPLNHTQGLGLWIIYWTVKMSDGTLELLESASGGTVIRISLPQVG